MFATMPVPSDTLELRRYQQEGIAYLTRYKRTILADEQGVGKTPQALVAARNLTQGRILVVAPKTAAEVWIDHAADWLGEEAKTYQGMTRAYEDLDNASIVVTNYHLLKEVVARHPHWSLIIYDEAHKLRNRERKTLYGVASKVSSMYLFFLTGTPIFSSAADLWPLLHIINPKYFQSYWGFARTWTHIHQEQYGPRTVTKVEGVKDPKRLQYLLNKEGFMIRRLKRDVMPELPPKQRVEWTLQMNPRQATAYKQLTKELFIELEGTKEGQILLVPSKLALITRLRQLLVSPRLLGLDFEGAAIEALTEQLGESQDAALVFTPFAEALPLLEEAMAKIGRETRTIRGGMNERKLDENIKWFQSYRGSREPVLLSSLLMGTSWTATRATQAYFLGYDWSPSNNFQAEDRLHRFGQKSATTVYYYVHRGTVDEHLMDILDKKVTVAKLVLDMRRFVLP